MDSKVTKITIEDLLDKISNYDKKEIEQIKKAYCYAENQHRNQTRQSGEPYITHPLAVAYILAEMNADTETLCAALLHDTLEDTKATKEELEELFGKNIANLVDGVTKICKMNFSTKKEQNMANTRKIITSMSNDIRIVIIKLADRLHNMRTLQYKSKEKQQENSLETMELYVPIAYQIGAYKIKSELEDLSLKYYRLEAYQRTEEQIQQTKKDSDECISEMLYKINEILSSRKIPNEIKVRIKNVYGVYRKLYKNNLKITDIHDLIAFKIMLKEMDDCYLLLRPIHNQYKPINSKFKDYIANPKTNMYKSLHTTVFGPNDRLVQVQLRTFDMEQIDSYGLTAYWNINKGNAREIMQEELKQKFQFYNSLLEINKVFRDNQEFVNQAKRELFSGKVYTYTPKGEIIELPIGSTTIDFAYALSSKIGNSMTSAIVNDEYVPLEYELKNKDRVRIITNDNNLGPRPEWANMAKTTHAKQLIKKSITTK